MEYFRPFKVNLTSTPSVSVGLWSYPDPRIPSEILRIIIIIIIIIITTSIFIWLFSFMNLIKSSEFITLFIIINHFHYH
jgi:hypothetical protein